MCVCVFLVWESNLPGRGWAWTCDADCCRGAPTPTSQVWFLVCSFDHRFYTGVRSFMFCSGVGDPLAASQCNGLTMRSRGRVLAQKLRRGPKQEFPGLPLYTLSSPCVCVCLHIMGCVLACCRSHRLYPDSTRSSGLAVIVRAQ